MTVRSTLQQLTERLPIWSESGINEAQTSQVIVLPILQALSYDIWNPYEVVAQGHSGGGSGGYCPDFTINIDSKTQYIVEVKALNKEFTSNDRTQSVNYVNALGRRWAVLTNGRLWHFFDNLVPQPAAEKLVLTVDIHDERASAYLNDLLSRKFWATPNAEDELASLVRRVVDDIRKRLKLGEIEQKLQQELAEGFTRDEKGLLKAIHLTLEPNERDLAEELFDELARRLLGASSSTSQAAPDSVAALIRQGVENTAPRTREAKSSNLEAWVQDEKLSAVNWRDLTAGLAEGALLAGKAKSLVELGYIFKSMDERRMGDGKPYLPSAYRPLSSGQYVFLNFSAKDHQRRCKQLLRLLGAPKGIIKVRFKDGELDIP